MVAPDRQALVLHAVLLIIYLFDMLFLLVEKVVAVTLYYVCPF